MSYKVYPVTKTELFCDDYSVKVNGKEIDLNTARVSAVPFNRRWPGHQRQIEQSEPIQFASLATDEPLCFEVVPKAPFEKVEIRPSSLGIKPEVQDGKISFTLERPAYFTIEPYGRNKALHIFADPISEYDIDKNDPDVIYYGKGEHDVGLITLKSNQTLFIDEGAVVYASVFAIDSENIKIVGKGILDNSRNKEQILFEANAEANAAAVKNAKRRRTIQLEYCTNIEIEGITIRDSLVYNIRPMACKNLKISNVKIIGCWRYNSDGIDMHNCEDVLIDNCFIRTFDDAICVKGFDCFYDGDVEKAVKEAMYRGGKAYDVFKNVYVKNCVIWNDWGKGLEIGAETRAEEIYNINYENCDIIHAMFPPIDCYNIDYAKVHDVHYQNINIELDDTIPSPQGQNSDSDTYKNANPDYCPPVVSVVTSYHPEYSAGGTRRGVCHDFTYNNINIFGRHKPVFIFTGYDKDHKTTNILVQNVYHNGNLLESIPEKDFYKNESTENIEYKVNELFEQLKKNNVSSKGQLKDSKSVRFENPDGNGIRVMFIGNSITLHGAAPQIGWNNECGMAASSKDKDYVHLLMSKINERKQDAAYCICQVSSWEGEYKNGASTYERFQSARDFGADIIIFRSAENCPWKDFDKAVFKSSMKDLLSFLDPEGRAKTVLSTSFWRHPADGAITEYAEENGLPLALIGDLGERDEMKAIGLFEHAGVANHPGDLGMKTIAERIFEKLEQYL